LVIIPTIYHTYYWCKDVENNIAANPPKLMWLGSVAGSIFGITTCEDAEKIWERGTKPQLIRM